MGKRCHFGILLSSLFEGFKKNQLKYIAPQGEACTYVTTQYNENVSRGVESCQ